MVILSKDIESIKDIVLKKAKYQKVMLIFDNSVTNVEINKIYECIKGICVYNTAHINSVNHEIFNGYKLLIFVCCADSFLKLNYNLEEFVNLFYLQNNEMLPFYLNEKSVIQNNDNYLITNSTAIDVCTLSSLELVSFYNYFSKMIMQIDDGEAFNFSFYEISYSSILSNLESVGKECFFVDVDILRNENIPYAMLPIVDLILIDAFLVFFSAVKNNSLMLVDVYKSAKDNYELIDKFYKQVNNDSILTIINLNFSTLFEKCKKTKENILKLITYDHLNFKKQEVIEKIKHYAKFCDGSLGYLYLYDVFNY